MKELSLDWYETDKVLKLLARKIRRNFMPDTVVGIARGGLVPAVRLSHLFGDKEFRVIQVKYYCDKKRLKKPKLISGIDRLSGKILLVDDVADTGGSLKFVLEHMKKNSKGKVKVATIACKPGSDFKPDYFIFETDKWIIFPWEKSSRN
jgi:hypothetical protein